MQTKKQSLIEIIISTAIGFVVSLISTFVLFPIVGINSTSSKNVVVTIFFTVISIVRGYFVRRIFNNFK